MSLCSFYHVLLLFDFQSIKISSSLKVTSMANLPQEIVTDILSRLPAKSIGQFSCVSKPWRTLLCDPKFIKTHLNRHTHDHEKLLLVSSSNSLFTLALRPSIPCSGDGVLKTLNVPDCEDNWDTVVGSCDGLALVVNEDECKCLINPTSFEYVKLSNSPVALNPRMSFSMHGFGYDSVNDDYKIVTLSYYDTDNEYEPDCAETFLDVYSAKMNSWRRLGSSPYDHAVPVLDSGKFLNGALHWLASKRSDYSSVLGAFSLANEVFEELPPPSALDKDKFVFKRLVVLEGCLCMIDDFRDHVDIWMMKEYGVGESWTKFCINVSYYDAKPLCLFGDKELAIADENNLMVTKLEEETSRDMVIDGTPIEVEDGVTFRESLLSPNLIIGIKHGQIEAVVPGLGNSATLCV